MKERNLVLASLIVSISLPRDLNVSGGECMLHRPRDGVLKGILPVLEGRHVVSEGGVPRPLAARRPQHGDLPRCVQDLAGLPVSRVLQPH